MFEDVNEKRSRWRSFWPEVDDLPGAEEAIRLSYWFAFAFATVTAILGVLVFLSGGGLSGLAGAIIVALIGVGVQRRWRSAAVAGLVFLGFGVVAVLVQRRVPGVMDALTLIAFISGVRGTFAHARLKKLAEQSVTGSIETATQNMQAG